MPNAIHALVTESRNPFSTHIDQLSTLDMLAVINQEDQKVPFAIEKVLPEIAQAVDAIAETFMKNGRLIYLGAGTSGRLGILDASECPPTFGTPHEQVVGLIAGGQQAILKAVENAEDDRSAGEQDLRNLALNEKDVVVGIAASGRTPYVLAGIEYANHVGCVTVGISCNPDSALAALANIAITPIVGPEVITGSSRMKAGTAQKLILNMLTTGAMIKTGKVFGNLMVDVVATNEKLVERQKNIVMEVTQCDRQQAEQALLQSNGQCKVAIVMLLLNMSAEEAKNCLAQANGFIHQALTLVK
ncbi:TPA: N-acetylmuramic acid 6-phosphate etherase [Pasteurella multocida]|uniref:N-acetylmuramic acid 6-phosphate etherase n=1 Tax=Pasteurella multocida TaxID=747 RepID=A0A9X3URZ9_PASMD|nr:N-acetylmuramic acid 6-phosphate etherase [Pasteurella multocida]AHE65217.1 N-acetylmuramic acid 6-phosphate etherase [Pasteurella multocida subsp. multocida str. HB03]AIN48710.1 N-acetylmuramic acid 6-phosphate etherase [Pasteurella multocida]APB79079.1 N-acetylmuramic acid 6-phosphate etherase [Pasteurella multocida]ARB73759.1 N-acetylmuramic acid 6-phosphate etherase [Pasteurella multocida]ARB75441.1 N-acetylmuramic acid 6-phosphate etherase [Pasteurella multocida]